MTESYPKFLPLHRSLSPGPPLCGPKATVEEWGVDRLVPDRRLCETPRQRSSHYPFIASGGVSFFTRVPESTPDQSPVRQSLHRDYFALRGRGVQRRASDDPTLRSTPLLPLKSCVGGIVTSPPRRDPSGSDRGTHSCLGPVPRLSGGRRLKNFPETSQEDGSPGLGLGRRRHLGEGKDGRGGSLLDLHGMRLPGGFCGPWDRRGRRLVLGL